MTAGKRSCRSTASTAYWGSGEMAYNPTRGRIGQRSRFSVRGLLPAGDWLPAGHQAEPHGAAQASQVVVREEPAGRLDDTLPGGGLVQGQEAATDASSCGGVVVALRLEGRVLTGTGPIVRRSRRRGSHSAGTSLRGAGRVDASADAGEGSSSETRGGRGVGAGRRDVAGSVIALAPKPERGGAEEAGGTAETAGRLCSGCLYGYLGAYGVYCVEYREFIDREEVAEECADYEDDK